MTYTFGGATGDDAWLAGSVTPGANLTCFLMMGWWMPTTLTATRCYWGVGTTGDLPPKLLVDTTTSELRMMSNHVTDGIWVTSGAVITTLRWQFIAVAGSLADGLGDWRVWVGNESQSPRAVSFSQSTAPVGAATGTSRRVWGNSGSSGTSAIQGDVGPCVSFACSSHVVGNMLSFRNGGVIADVEADATYHRFVFPFWRGQFNPFYVLPGGTQNYESVYWDSLGARGYGPSNNLGVADATLPVTVTGATLAANNRPPVVPLPDCVMRAPVPFIRRAA